MSLGRIGILHPGKMGIEVAANAIVNPKARIAENVYIGPFSIIEDEVEIGDGTRLDSRRGRTFVY